MREGQKLFHEECNDGIFLYVVELHYILWFVHTCYKTIDKKIEQFKDHSQINDSSIHLTLCRFVMLIRNVLVVEGYKYVWTCFFSRSNEESTLKKISGLIRNMFQRKVKKKTGKV